MSDDLKTKSKADRINKGNKCGASVINYFNHRFHAGLNDLNGDRRDMFDGIDCEGESDFSAQIKFRESGRDTIYAFQRWHGNEYDEYGAPIVEKGWRTELDRDSRTKAKFNIIGSVLLPYIAVVPSPQMKNVLKICLGEWGVPFQEMKNKLNDTTGYLIDVPDQQVTDWYRQALNSPNQSIQVYRSERYVMKNQAPEIKFKIDEGIDDSFFCKLILFCPVDFFDSRKVFLREGEAVLNSDTWLPSNGEKFEECWD